MSADVSARAAYKLALAGLRHRAAGSVAAFLAVMLGCALLVACGGLFETAIRLDAPPVRLAGVPVVVSGETGFKLPDQESQRVPYAERTSLPADTMAAVAAVRGVGRVVGDVSFPAGVMGERSAAGDGQGVGVGHGWASATLTPYTLDAGAPPSDGQVVLDRGAGFELGGKVEVLVNGVPRTLTVSGLTNAPGGLFFSDSDATRFAPRAASVDLIGVWPADGVTAAALAERLRAAGFTVHTGDDRGTAEFVGVNASRLPLILLAAVFGGMVLVVMALVVSTTIGLTVRQRQRELALLRAGGATPGQVRRMVVVETVAVAVVATVAGLALGAVVGRAVFASSVEHGVLPGELRYYLGVVPFAGAAALSILAPWLTARIASGAAARPRPIQALAEAAIPAATVHPLRQVLALGFAGATLVLAVTTMFMPAAVAGAVGGPAGLTGVIAITFVAPKLVAWVAGRIAPYLRTPDARLAAVNTRARARAYAAVLVPMTLAVAVTFGNVYSQTTRGAALAAADANQLAADVVVTAPEGVSPGLLATVREAPGVKAASALVSSRGWIEDPYDRKGSDPDRLLGAGPGVIGVETTEGSLDQLTGATVAVPAGRADDLGLSVGDEVTLRLGDGAQVRTRVVALLDSPSNYPATFVPADLLASHTAVGLATHVLAVGGDADGIAERLEDWPGVTASGNGSLRELFAAGSDVEAWINYLLAVLAIAYAAIAAVNSLAVTVLTRRREMGVQRLAGATQSQVRRMLLIEGCIVGSTALLLGTVISLFTVVPTAFANRIFIPSGPIWVFFAVVAAIALIVLPVSALTARLAMRGGPMEALAGE